MTIELGAAHFTIITIVIAIIQFIFYELIKSFIKKRNDEFLESVKWDFKVKEQATKIAEYIALARSLSDNSSKEDFAKVNALVFELQLWLPKETFEKLGYAIKYPEKDNNVHTILNDIRKELLKDKFEPIDEDYFIEHGYSYEINRNT